MNWDLICWLLRDCSIIKSICRTFTRADRVLLLDPDSPDRAGTIYIAASPQKIPSFSNALIIYPLFEDDSLLPKPGCRNYICIADTDPLRIMNLLLQAQSHLDLLARKLSEATTDQDALDIASEYLQCPLFYFDASYRILAITRNFAFPEDAEWNHMLEKGFLSLDSIRLMQDSGDLDLLADKKDPFPYNSDIYPFESLVCNIWQNNLFFSRLNMLCLRESPTQLNIEECRILCSNLERIARSQGARETYTGPLNNMVLDLLKGLQLSEELIFDQLRHLPSLRNSLIRTGCVETKVSNDPQVLKYYSSLLERLFAEDQVLVLEFEEKIVLILHAPEEAAFQPLFEKLGTLLTSQGLRCGISFSFQRFHTLRDHYLQAQAALSFHPNSQGICMFEDVYFDYLLSFLPAHQAAAMIDPGILRLLKVQDSYQFSLTDTLKQYLKCGCNLQMTAGALFIHKNTALYRLNHIREILQTDLEDPVKRMELVFSFKILEKYPVL